MEVRRGRAPQEGRSQSVTARERLSARTRFPRKWVFLLMTGRAASAYARLEGKSFGSRVGGQLHESDAHHSAGYSIPDLLFLNPSHAKITEGLS